MADIETTLRTLTLSNASVSAAFGQRYYIDRMPSNVTTYPVIRAQTVSDIEMDVHDNSWGSRAVVQLDVWDDDKPNCNVNAAIVRNWLHRYRGAFGDGIATIKVRNAPSVPDPDTHLFRRILEIDILFTKS